MNDEPTAQTGASTRAAQNDLRGRTKRFALDVLRLYGTLPKTVEAQITGKQCLRCGTSVGAHYREATRARSDADFISKIEVALQELEETQYWLELLAEGEIVPPNDARVLTLHAEAEQLIRIFVASVRTVKKHKQQRHTMNDEVTTETMNDE